MKSKKRIIIGVVIILLLLIAIAVSKIIEEKKAEEERIIEKNQDRGAKVLEAYRNKDFDAARKQAKKLDEKYEDYYVDFINYAEEISEWNGTGEELYNWLEEFYEFYDESGYAQLIWSSEDAPNVIGFFWVEAGDLKEDFDAMKEQMKIASEWTTEYNKDIEEYYNEYFRIFSDTRNLFAYEGDNIGYYDSVDVNVAKTRKVIADMNTLNEDITKKLDEYAKKYKDNENIIWRIENQQEYCKKLNELYSEKFPDLDFYAYASASEDYEYLGLDLATAKKLYNIDDLQMHVGKCHFSFSNIMEELQLKTDERQEVLPDDIFDYDVATYIVMDHALNLFEYVIPTIDGEYAFVDYNEIYDKYF